MRAGTTSEHASRDASRVGICCVVWVLLLTLLLPGLRTLALAAPVDRPLDEFFKEVWTTREGLPHNLVHKIVQTPDGYLWFATWEGVARYNGREFHVFDRGNVPELRDDGVRAMALGSGGALWLGTSRGGITRYRDGEWTTFTTSDGLAQDEIIDLLEDRGERLWVATETAGITMREPDGRMRSYGRQHGLPSLVMSGLAEDSDGTLWAATAEGLARFESDRFVRVEADFGLPPGAVLSVAASADGGLFVGTEKGAFRRAGGRFLPIADPLLRDNVIRLLADRSGAVWLGSVNGGVYRYRAGTIDQLGSRRGLLNDRVSALFQDREGSLWIGTNAGLMRLRDAAFTTFTTEHGLPDDYVRAVLGTDDGTLWIGTSHGLGYLREGRFGGITRADGLPADSILSLAPSRDGSLWLGTYSSGVIRWNDGVQQVLDVDSGLIGNQVRAVVEARDGTLWVGTTRGLTRRDARGSRHFTVADGLPRDFIISLLEDRRGALWIGTSNGLARIIGESIEVFSLAHLDDAQDVFGLHEGADGALWLATDRGLIRMRDGELRLISRKQGLRQGKVFQMLVDGRGQAWLTSNRGIERASLADLDAAADGTLDRVGFESFGESDGMMSSQANGGSGPVAWRTPDDRLWFGTAKGV